MNTIFIIIMLAPTTFLISNHPLFMGLSIIFQAMFISSLISLTFFFSWFSFLIFIVYLGGILMLFSYIISMIQIKETMMTKTKLLTSIYSLILIFYTLLNPSFIFSDMILSFKEIKYEHLILLPFSSSYKTSISLLIFLLFIMIVVVLLIESSKGSMRSL